MRSDSDVEWRSHQGAPRESAGFRRIECSARTHVRSFIRAVRAQRLGDDGLQAERTSIVIRSFAFGMARALGRASCSTECRRERRMTSRRDRRVGRSTRSGWAPCGISSKWCCSTEVIFTPSVELRLEKAQWCFLEAAAARRRTRGWKLGVYKSEGD